MGNTQLSCASGEKGTKAQRQEEQYTKAPTDKPTNGEATKHNGTEETNNHIETAKDGEDDVEVETVERIETTEIKSQESDPVMGEGVETTTVVTKEEVVVTVAGGDNSNNTEGVSKERSEGTDHEQTTPATETARVEIIETVVNQNTDEEESKTQNQPDVKGGDAKVSEDGQPDDLQLSLNASALPSDSQKQTSELSKSDVSVDVVASDSAETNYQVGFARSDNTLATAADNPSASHSNASADCNSVVNNSTELPQCTNTTSSSSAADSELIEHQNFSTSTPPPTPEVLDTTENPVTAPLLNSAVEHESLQVESAITESDNATKESNNVISEEMIADTYSSPEQKEAEIPGQCSGGEEVDSTDSVEESKDNNLKMCAEPEAEQIQSSELTSVSEIVTTEDGSCLEQEIEMEQENPEIAEPDPLTESLTTEEECIKTQQESAALLSCQLSSPVPEEKDRHEQTVPSDLNSASETINTTEVLKNRLENPTIPKNSDTEEMNQQEDKTTNEETEPNSLNEEDDQSTAPEIAALNQEPSNSEVVDATNINHPIQHPTLEEEISAECEELQQTPKENKMSTDGVTLEEVTQSTIETVECHESRELSVVKLQSDEETAAIVQSEPASPEEDLADSQDQDDPAWTEDFLSDQQLTTEEKANEQQEENQDPREDPVVEEESESHNQPTNQTTSAETHSASTPEMLSDLDEENVEKERIELHVDAVSDATISVPEQQTTNETMIPDNEETTAAESFGFPDSLQREPDSDKLQPNEVVVSSKSEDVEDSAQSSDDKAEDKEKKKDEPSANAED